MIKKLVSLAATALFSMNASAGYVQYDLSFGTQGGLSGTIVQHDSDQSIAFFELRIGDYASDYGQQFSSHNDDGCICIVSESTYFRNNGPTNFRLEDSYGGDHFTAIDVNFSRSTKGNFAYIANYDANFFANIPQYRLSGVLSGVATLGAVDPRLARYLDQRGGYEIAVPQIIPTYIKSRDVPEPASLTLFALGAAGLASIRRRKAAR